MKEPPDCPREKLKWDDFSVSSYRFVERKKLDFLSEIFQVWSMAFILFQTAS